MLVTPFGIVILVRLAQSENAQLPMIVTLSGTSMLARPQALNAESPILVVLLGIPMLVRRLQ